MKPFSFAALPLIYFTRTKRALSVTLLKISNSYAESNITGEKPERIIGMAAICLILNIKFNYIRHPYSI
jgi:hypothetical protein